MAFDLNIWRAEVRRNVEDFARDPRGALGRAGVDTVYGFLLGSTVLPVIAAYNADPAATIGAVISVLGGLGANLLANLAQRKYDDAPIAAAAAEAQSPELAPAYQAITQQTEVLQLAEQALQQAGQAEILAQLRDELRRLAPGGPFAGATIVQQQSGGVNFGVGNTIGSVGDMVTGSQTRGAVDNQGHIDGVVVGVNLGTIIYGRTPQEDERRRLVWYLDALANKLYRLPLRGIEQKLDQGEGLALPKVYVELTTTSEVVVASGNVEQLHEYLDLDRLRGVPWVDIRNPLEFLRTKFQADWALPSVAFIGSKIHSETHGRQLDLTIQFIRRCLAAEAVAQFPSLVLLGDPGSGKSTFMRHLAWTLAQRGLEQPGAPELFGWPGDAHALPLLLPLRTVANHIAIHGAQPRSVAAALSAELSDTYNVHEAAALVEQVLHSRSALLLLDGLDEVPIEAPPGRHANRAAVLRVVREFAQLYPSARFVLTCRTRAFDDALRAELGWHAKTLAPFTLGQIRHFVPAWYGELVAHGQLDTVQAKAIEQKLINSITDPQRTRLRAMAENPLLLTMMVLVLYNQGDLPRDRPQLYERILDLLLGQWDKVRDGQSLAEVIGVSDWGSERLRPLLDQLSFQAHAGATSADGRGRLARRDVREALERFFIQAGMRDEQAAAASVRCLDYFNHRSGLLVPDTAQDSYVFAHLTLQEHSAGRALALDLNAAALVMQHRADDRWREPIFLGLGVAQQINPALLDRVLSDLIDEEEAGLPKPVERRQRDLIFAAEIGKDRDWGYLRTQRVNVDRLQRDLKRGLVALLADKAQPLQVADRVRAGFLLGELGDPRYPVTLDDWRRELAKVERGDTSGYFCKVEAGTYTIGSTDEDPDAREAEKSQHQVTFDTPFWIGRYPITNEQWQHWVMKGDGKTAYHVLDTTLNYSNQPVVGVDWYRCSAFSTWLGEQLGFELRLPKEKEWEAAARGGDVRRYPWGEMWVADHAATEEDRNLRGHRWSVPVGCYPAGAAPCGALDFVGNVSEWTASVWQAYPGAKKLFISEDWCVLRGGGWNSNRDHVSCSVRINNRPDLTWSNDYGFRVVAVPRSH